MTLCGGLDWQWEGGGRKFSLQLVRESIKEGINMTANAVTHQTLAFVCVCVCVCVCGVGQ